MNLKAEQNVCEVMLRKISLLTQKDYGLPLTTILAYLCFFRFIHMHKSFYARSHVVLSEHKHTEFMKLALCA